MEKSYQGALPEIIYAHEYTAQTYRKKIRLLNNAVEIGYITEGELTCSVDEKRVFNIQKSDIFLYNGDMPIWIDSDVLHTHRTVGFLLDVNEIKGIDLKSFPILLEMSEGVFPLHRLIDEIIEVYSQEPENKILLGGLALTLFSKAMKKVEQLSDGRRFGELAYVEKAKKFVYENMRRPITQAEIAEHLRITSGYLCNIFKRVTGETMMSFINRTKLRQIKAVMDRENVKLTKAAEMYGYIDPNYVSRIYKKYFGENITENKRL